MIIEATYDGTPSLYFEKGKRYKLGVYGNTIKDIKVKDSMPIPYTLAGFLFIWKDIKFIAK